MLSDHYIRNLVLLPLTKWPCQLCEIVWKKACAELRYTLPIPLTLVFMP